MHFSLAIIIAVVPLLASASPLAKQPHSTISLARKSNLHQDDGSLDADKLSGHLSSSIDKFKRGFETYERNTGKRHPLQSDVVSAGTKRDFAQQDITQMLFHRWSAPIMVGNPPQEFWVEVDTSTSDLVIPDDSCQACSNNRYKSDASTSSKPLGKPFSIEKNHSVVSGYLYSDEVDLVSSLEITNQTLGSATTFGNILSESSGPDGLLGLGFGIVSVFNAPTVFENLVAEHQALESVFALKINNAWTGWLTLGGIDPDAFTGTPIYTPVAQEGFWNIKFDSFKVGDSVVAGPTHALMDSGTKFVVGSKDAVKAIYARVKGSEEAKDTPGFFTFPCASRIPPISITLGDNELFMEAPTVSLGPISKGSDTCKGSVVYEETFGNAAWVFGDSWMANFYTIFDVEKKRIGFATPTPT